MHLLMSCNIQSTRGFLQIPQLYFVLYQNMRWHCFVRDAKHLQRWNEFVEHGEIQVVSCS